MLPSLVHQGDFNFLFIFLWRKWQFSFFHSQISSKFLPSMALIIHIVHMSSLVKSYLLWNRLWLSEVVGLSSKFMLIPVQFLIESCEFNAGSVVTTKVGICQSSKECLKEGYLASNFEVWVDMAGVWSQEIKTKSSASPKEMECCDLAKQERNAMWPASLLKW